MSDNNNTTPTTTTIDDIYEQLSQERKNLQSKGELPDWFITGGWQLFKKKYSVDGQSPRDRYWTIAETAARHASNLYGKRQETWTKTFFDLLWKGWLSPSTPVLANMGTDRGCPVSCTGNFIDDSIDGFYTARHETAILTKHGFGTSSYMGYIRPRGRGITPGGKASGSLPVLKGFVQDMREVSQGSQRRGAWAGYLELEHEDFYEWITYLYNYPSDLNIGWIMTDSFIDRLNNGDTDAITRYQKMMKTKMVTGKGYIFMVDKANRTAPAAIRDHPDLKIWASNLCSEIALPSDTDHSFTCVLSSINLSKWDEFKHTNAIFHATVFLDCVAQEFIEMGRTIRGMENTVRFTEKSRALGLGVLGFHTYLQQNMIPFESFDAHMINNQIFKAIQDESYRASSWMAERTEEPEWCQGSGRRNLTTEAIAPTMSTAMICGGVSQGIEPVLANVYNQASAGGEVMRINPTLIKIMQNRGIYNKKTLNDIIDHSGSVQHVKWLSDDEKSVFKTAFEIDQRAILRQASTRQQFIDQGQSLNLFFAADEDESYISEIHREAILDPNIKALYYLRSMAGIKASKGEASDCVACEG